MECKTIEPRTEVEWRQWLMENHKTEKSVWLIFTKAKHRNETITLTYEQAVRQSLCFGWIDSRLNPIDDIKHKQQFSPRRPNSEWSRVNKNYIVELVASGQMAESGLDAIERAKLNGSWTKMDIVEDLVVPADLAEEFEQNPVAKKNFDKLSRSRKKTILRSLVTAKRPETRDKRLRETIKSLR